MLHRYVFSLRLKLARVSADLTDSGRLPYCRTGDRENGESCQSNFLADCV